MENENPETVKVKIAGVDGWKNLIYSFENLLETFRGCFDKGNTLS